jgi:polyferredoxin
VIVYPSLLAVVAALLVWSVAGRPTTEITALRIDGPSFMTLPDGRIASQVRLKIENASSLPRRYVVALAGAADATLISPLPAWEVAPHHAQQIPLLVQATAASFVHGERRVQLRVYDEEQPDARDQIVTVALLGPTSAEPAESAEPGIPR